MKSVTAKHVSCLAHMDVVRYTIFIICRSLMGGFTYLLLKFIGSPQNQHLWTGAEGQEI